MASYNTWLDDIRPSPYADQLSVGFRWLRFSSALEHEYRTYLLKETFELRRIALSMATVIWLGFAALDLVLVQPPQLWWILAVRLVVLLVMLVCAGLILQRRHTRLLLPLSLVCILALGCGSALVVAIAHHADPSYPYEGLLLVSIATYFLVGLRLGEAATCALAVLLVYISAELLAGLALSQLITSVLFLLFGNLMGAVGCYLLEYKSREHFLVSRLLRLLADRDSLTGLHNRRSFNRHCERLWRQAQRNDQSLALLLCDIDHFKAYNDCYGHQAGDAALQRVGLLIERAARRPLDMAVRLGGEEFAVLLFDIEVEEACEYAEILRGALVDLNIAHQGSTSAGVLSMSIGVACVRPSGNDGFRQLYEYADQALYEAKAFGRNRVMA